MILKKQMWGISIKIYSPLLKLYCFLTSCFTVCFPKSRCPKTGVCLSNELFCDGNNDCKDGEDERKPCRECLSINMKQFNAFVDIFMLEMAVC